MGLEKKTELRKTHVSGTVGGPLLTLKSHTMAYISQNWSSGSENPVSGGPPVTLKVAHDVLSNFLEFQQKFDIF